MQKIQNRLARRAASTFALLASLSLLVPAAFAQATGSGTSEFVTWNCVGDDCPWGSPLSNHALVWPEGSGAASSRRGYETNSPVYLPAEIANEAIIWVDSGVASLYAGEPSASSHRFITDVAAGDYYVVSDLAPGEVLSAQSGSSFDYQIDLPPPPQPEVPNGTRISVLVSWDCSGADCPWGPSATGQAIVWDESVDAGSSRLGYTTSYPVYLASGYANGARISIESGSASVYAGYPDASSHRFISELNAGDQYLVDGVEDGEVFSVQNGSSSFSYRVLELGEPPIPPPPAPNVGELSETVTWTCNTSPCPWGSPLSGQAVVWPDTTGSASSRLGYETSGGVYLPAAYANGAVIQIESGSALILAGNPQANSHRVLATLSEGNFLEISGLASDEVLSVQNDFDSFRYSVTLAEPPPAGGGGAGGEDPPPTGGAAESEVVTWTCGGSNCPWGGPLSGNALVWPSESSPTNQRLGYITSHAVYLPYTYANGTSFTIESGSANVYVGAPDASSHQFLTSLNAGDTYVVSGVSEGEVVSVQNDYDSFTYSVILGDPVDGGSDPGDPPPDNGGDPPADAIQSITANWYCDVSDCYTPPWTGRVIDWPSWSAYPNNNRSGDQSRTVFDANTGEMLFPYMGSWADGCEVSVHTGQALIIEWERGTDTWRETYVDAGNSYTIDLVGSEDGALIESNYIDAEFSVTVANCTPAALVE